MTQRNNFKKQKKILFSGLGCFDSMIKIKLKSGNEYCLVGHTENDLELCFLCDYQVRDKADCHCGLFPDEKIKRNGGRNLRCQLCLDAEKLWHLENSGDK